MNAHIMIGARERATCPKCSHSFAIADGLSQHTIECYAQDYENALANRTREIQLQAAAASRVEIDQLRAGELELRRRLREAEDQRRGREVEYQRRLDEERKRIEERVHSQAGEELARLEAQHRTQLESLRREADDLRRKAGQGSQQTQGEALELSLESMLRSAFPLDDISPVPKGVNGADLLQRVRTPNGQVCGTIAWESKETKNWQPAWIAKLKDDQRAAGAEVAVLVTTAMPKEAREPFVRESDVWIARIDAARPLAEALRTTLLEIHKVRVANTGRNEKMELLYDFIHSPRFAQRVQLVYETFDAMRAELDAEQKAIMKIWKKREAQIARVTSGLIAVVGELQGLADDGLPALQSVAAFPALEDPFVA